MFSIETDLAAMVPDDLVGNRETESVPIRLSVTDKRLKNGVLKRFGDAGAVI